MLAPMELLQASGASFLALAYTMHTKRYPSTQGVPTTLHTLKVDVEGSQMTWGLLVGVLRLAALISLFLGA